MNERTVIVGAGQAGGELAVRLRRAGWEGEILLIGEEPHAPYQRPPLSKKYLLDDWTADRLLFRPAHAYAQDRIELLSGVLVAEIDRVGCHVVTNKGARYAYNWLVLATGARPRQLFPECSSPPGVHTLRTIADVDALRPHFTPGRRLVVIGAGYIGLEIAAVARTRGLHVLVIEAGNRPLMRSIGENMAQRVAALHLARGVSFKFDTSVRAIEGAEALVLSDGTTERADLVVVGVGAEPASELARLANLAGPGAIQTDALCRTEDPRIFAIGDCAARKIAGHSAPVRLESVHNAIEGAKIVAAQIAGQQKPTPEAPWFWSDQYDAKLQMVGLTSFGDQEVRRLDGDAIAIFYLRAGVVVAVHALNHPSAFVVGKTLIQEGRVVDASIIADSSLSMKGVLGLCRGNSR